MACKCQIFGKNMKKCHVQLSLNPFFQLIPGYPKIWVRIPVLYPIYHWYLSLILQNLKDQTWHKKSQKNLGFCRYIHTWILSHKFQYQENIKQNPKKFLTNPKVTSKPLTIYNMYDIRSKCLYFCNSSLFLKFLKWMWTLYRFYHSRGRQTPWTVRGHSWRRTGPSEAFHSESNELLFSREINFTKIFVKMISRKN